MGFKLQLADGSFTAGAAVTGSGVSVAANNSLAATGAATVTLSSSTIVVDSLVVSGTSTAVTLQPCMVAAGTSVSASGAATLTLGMTFSSVARNQLQAMQMTIFYFLPSILLSGFMFPFRGMPVWAQWIGNILPLTHFLVLVRGILLKGLGMDSLWPHVWPILAFTAVVLALGLKTYRRTLD